MYDLENSDFLKSGRKPVSKILAIGDPREWEDRDRIFPDAKDMSFLNFEKFDEAALEHYQPHSIYSQVLTPNFDCVELAVLLQNLAFDGIYKAFGRNLPKPKLVEREVRQSCPGVNFEVVQLTT